MKIESIRTMNGPNIWSIRRQKLIVMTLNLEEMEDCPSNKITGFPERLKQLLPSLYTHRCSEGVPGGFFHRVDEGTWLGHIIEHVALEIQTLAGMETGFGRTRSTGKDGVYHVVFSYLEARAGKYAAEASVRIVEALIKGEEYDLAKDIQELKWIYEDDKFGPSTGSLVEEAAKRGIPYIRLDKSSLVQLGYGVHQKRIQATVASTTSNIAVELAGDKDATKSILDQAEVPVPKGEIIYDEQDLRTAVESIGFPVVIKPLDGNHGKGATTNINSIEEALVAMEIARKYSKAIICESYITGKDFRGLVINYKFVAAALRTPAAVIGDGQHTIQQLIDITNKDPKRGEGHNNMLTEILVDAAAMEMLGKKGYTLETVLPEGEEMHLKHTANLSTGGTATDVTDQVHPKNVALFERIARVIGLDICGIDIIATDLERPVTETGGAVIEVNAGPGFRMHLEPTTGKHRNVAGCVIDMLFPKDKPTSIPIIAVTGTNGKTTTSRMVAHITKQAGYCVGYTTTEGIYLNGEKVVSGDCSGPTSAQFVLKDTSVDLAVLECARGGILRSGLGFQSSDVAIVTNVAEDHLGIGGIDTIEKLAKVKAVVAESVKETGYAILNAEDDLVYQMREELECKVALFAVDEKNERIIKHAAEGGLAAIASNNYVTILHKGKKIKVEKVQNIPITFNGKARFNIANVLGASLAAYVSNISIDVIKQSLQSFVPSPQLTPGRMNMFKFSNFNVMVDYAHNPHGIQAVGEFIKSMKASKRIGIIAGVGDRRDEDIVAVGTVAANMFDEIIIRQDDDKRGRSVEEINDLLKEGIRKVSKKIKISEMDCETTAIDFALDNAKPNVFIVFFSDKVEKVIEHVTRRLQQDQEATMPRIDKTVSEQFPLLKSIAM
ncbi:MAG: cphA [Segetibacter sp.]|nr:cphA [Segetibacter sp.]